ncbi:MAG: DUF2785 domain-containing protein [Nocardioidaceae bacterium]
MVGDFWQRVLESEMAVPEGRPLPDLTAELVTMLGSTDPVERDEIAFPVLATWISEGVYDDLLVTFGDSICTGLDVGLGESGTDTVFRRSFSALVLGVCIERDNEQHLLPMDSVLSWADHSLTWLSREQDLRGWVPGKGWAHTIAHGADLMGALGQSRHLEAAHLRVLLEVVSERLVTPTPYQMVDEEDDRLALAALTILQRNLIEPGQLDEWVESLTAGIDLAAVPTDDGKPGMTPATLNTSHFVRALHAHLAIGVAPPHHAVDFGRPPDCRADLLLALLRVIPRFTPWLYSSTPQQPHDPGRES